MRISFILILLTCTPSRCTRDVLVRMDGYILTLSDVLFLKELIYREAHAPDRQFSFSGLCKYQPVSVPIRAICSSYNNTRLFYKLRHIAEHQALCASCFYPTCSGC